MLLLSHILVLSYFDLSYQLGIITAAIILYSQGLFLFNHIFNHIVVHHFFFAVQTFHSCSNPREDWFMGINSQGRFFFFLHSNQGQPRQFPCCPILQGRFKFSLQPRPQPCGTPASFVSFLMRLHFSPPLGLLPCLLSPVHLSKQNIRVTTVCQITPNEICFDVHLPSCFPLALSFQPLWMSSFLAGSEMQFLNVLYILAISFGCFQLEDNSGYLTSLLLKLKV